MPVNGPHMQAHGTRAMGKRLYLDLGRTDRMERINSAFYHSKLCFRSTPPFNLKILRVRCPCSLIAQATNKCRYNELPVLTYKMSGL